ncbi:ABC transporter ATP-binding protein [Haloplasma contractile]|uniref:ABC transporter protein n=1 Tax=Haloplasma contractile SSD-17B TaxID=1033810 RepID=U2ED15_9MOLU|nr:ABC transporter ATP-binding protein [Haloplasma contractile]ERJ12913.1 ABC transporter protein [Haloplasma contractile SSD-17B]
MKNYVRTLKTYMAPYWYIAILTPLLMLVEVYFVVQIPRLIGETIDVAIPNGISTGNYELIIDYTLRILLVSVGAIACGFLATVFSNISTALMGRDMSNATYKRLQELSFENIDKIENGKILTRIVHDPSRIRWMTKMIMQTFFRAPAMFIFTIIEVVKINRQLSYILVIISPLIILVNVVVIRKGYPKFRIVRRKFDKVNTLTAENLENNRIVKAFNRNDYEIDKYDGAIEELKETTTGVNRLMAISSPVLMLIMNLSIAAVLYIGGTFVIEGTIDIGKIQAFIIYLGQSAGALMAITGLLNIVPRVETLCARVLGLQDMEPAVKNNSEPKSDFELTGKIEFKNVTYSYGDLKPVLKNINFTIEPGQKLGIIGTTGSGKSTLVNLIPRFYDVKEGEVLLDGINVREYDLKELRKQVSVVMQKASLFAGTIGDNIRFGNQTAEEDEIIDSSKTADAHEFINRFNDQYETYLGERGVNLSGGQKQRTSISRSVITAPKILIFDDSTSAVDMKTERRILSLLNRKLTQTTYIIIAQRISSIIDADKIIVLDNGEINGIGTHEELLDTNTIYQEIHYSQNGGEKYA